MAANVEDKNTCSICLKTFNEPKLIDCHHTFCLVCLEAYTKRFPSGNFPCPLCRRQIAIPKDGIKSFSSNFYIDVNTEVNLLDSCIHHRDKKAELYCTQCSDAVCSKCFTIKHNGHSFLDLESEDTLKEATGQTGSLIEQLTTYEKMLHGVKTSLKIKETELNASTKIAHDKIQAKVDKICTNAKQFGEQLSTIIISIAEKQHAKLDQVNVQLQQLTSDVTSARKLSEEITSKDPVIQVLNTLKFSKDVIEKQATVILPEVPKIQYPVFNEDGTDILLSVKQIGQCTTAKETTFESTFNFEDLKEEQKICSRDTKIIKGLSWSLAVRNRKETSKLGLYINLNAPGSENLLSCYTRFSITLVSSVESKSKTLKQEHEFNDGGQSWGWSFIDWDKFIDPANGYIENNKLTVSSTIRINHIKRKEKADVGLQNLK